jgi:uncharacterized protein UPF0158
VLDEQQQEEGTAKKPMRKCPVRWDDLTAAFENNAPDVHSFLNVVTGHVLRIVDGTPGADEVLARVSRDPDSIVVDAVSSRDQYRWMERFIETTEDAELKDRLTAAIDGKGAFRRFKDVLLSYPDERERWFQFRQDLLKVEMDSWLASLGIEAVPPPQPEPPPPEEVVEGPPSGEPPPARSAGAEALRRRLHEVADQVPGRDLAGALAFLEYLRDRRPPSRGRSSVRRTQAGGAPSSDAPGEGSESDLPEPSGAPAHDGG